MLLRHDDLKPAKPQVNRDKPILKEIGSVVNADGVKWNGESRFQACESDRFLKFRNVIYRVDIGCYSRDSVGQRCRRSSYQNDAPPSFLPTEFGVHTPEILHVHIHSEVPVSRKLRSASIRQVL